MTPDSRDEEAAPEEAAMQSSGRGRRSLAYFLMMVLVVLLLAFIPPLVNVSRFQRRVDASISAALGRPVHFDRLSLNLLPLPGFTLENFVIEEDPAFGYEPTLHADEVRINLRLSSLWRRRVEFSSISFTDPSVNLVHSPDGRWNIQTLLLQASRISAAPTAQAYAGPAPRFPYIEATGARVNLKLDQEKMPVSLSDADFALWQPAEHQWQMRVEAHPLRTDITPGASGTLRIEGTMGGDGERTTLAGMPIDLHMTWQDAQLGGLTSLMLGRDAGLRGGLTASMAMLGTVGRSTITAAIGVEDAHRADFIPRHEISISVDCQATAENSLHSFPAIHCRLPLADSPAQATLALAASVPDVRRPKLSSVRVDVPALPSQTLFDWLGVATPHPPTAFAGKGRLTGALQWGVNMQSAAQAPAGDTAPPLPPTWTGELRLSGEWLHLPALGQDDAPLDDIVLRSTPIAVRAAHSRPSQPVQDKAPVHDSFDLLPASLPLGGEHPAILSGHLDDSGYSLELSGPVVLDQLISLGDAIPQFGDGLKELVAPEDSSEQRGSEKAPGAERIRSTNRGHDLPGPPEPLPAPVSIDISASRAWGTVQTWTRNAPAPTVPRRTH